MHSCMIHAAIIAACIRLDLWPYELRHKLDTILDLVANRSIVHVLRVDLDLVKVYRSFNLNYTMKYPTGQNSQLISGPQHKLSSPQYASWLCSLYEYGTLWFLDCLLKYR